MNSSSKSVVDELLELDLRGPGNRQAVEDEATRLFAPRLSTADWARLALMGGGGLAASVVCGSLAVTEPASTPQSTRLILASFAGVGLFWTALAATIAMRKRSLPWHRAIAAKMGFALALAAAGLIGVLSAAGGNATAAPGMLLLALAPVILAAVVVISQEVRQAELRVQKRLLEVDYRMARLTESVLLRPSAEA